MVGLPALGRPVVWASLRKPLSSGTGVGWTSLAILHPGRLPASLKINPIQTRLFLGSKNQGGGAHCAP